MSTLGLVLAGGKGSQLSVLTEQRAKPALPVGGSYCLIDFALSNLANSQIESIAVLAQFQTQTLSEHIGDGQVWSKAGIPFAHSDVAEYLEHQARQRLAGVPVPPQQVSGGGSAQKVRANGSRTLSAATGSERRASPKPLEEMSPDEERNALIEAVAEARRASGS